VRIFVYGEPVNMRLSYDGLYAMIQNVMGQDPMSGHLYAFINRRATQIKVMYWDRSGFCIWSKRLESGRLLSDAVFDVIFTVIRISGQVYQR
jgi:transposase